MSDSVEHGWGWPANSRKAHYFVECRSLCGRWLYFGQLELGKDNSPDNCAGCKKALQKKQKKK